MTLVGKLLTGLIFVMSVAFMMLAAILLATHRNWREEVVGDGGLRQQIQEKDDMINDLNEELKESKDQLAVEQAARRFALASLQSRLQQVEDQYETREAEFAELQGINGNLVETLRTNQINLEKLTSEVVALRDNLREAWQARDDKFLEVQQLTDEINRIEGTRQTLQERYAQLSDQVARMSSVLDRHDLTEFEPVDSIPPRVDGVVTAVGQSNLVEISIGSDDGLRAGHTLEVYRNNSYLGRIVIQRTEPDRAVGKILREYRNGVIRKGDRVATKLT